MILADNLYRAQIMFYETIFDGLRQDIHDFYFLKSRQLGISTGTRPLSLYWLGMHEGLRGALVFDSAFNTSAARREIEETLQNLPARLHFPKIRSKNRDALILENDSWLMFMQAGTKNSRAGGGLGRSLGLNFVHASELSSWANEEGVTSFRQALAQDFENRLFINESTARGYELWYKLYTDAQKDQLTKRTCFIGWWAKDNQIIKKNDPKFSVYGVDPPNKREEERINTVRDLYDWDVTPEQLAWYRWTTDPSRDLEEDDEEDSFLLSEQPWCESEAFQSTGSSFFMGEKLSAAMSALQDEVKPKTYRFLPGLDFVTSDIQPAKFKREVEFRVWEEPVTDAVYVVAADPAFGHDEDNDNSAVQVLRCFADGVEQAAEFASATIHPHHFAWLLWSIIGYYGSTMPGCRVQFICEINGPGAEVWRQFQATERIVRDGYLRAAAREKGIADIFGNVSRYIYTRADSMSGGGAWMFQTSGKTKVPIMEACRGYFHNGMLLVRSMEALEEMRTITRSGDTIEAEGANRDDRTFSLALGIEGWTKVRPSLISGNRTRAAEKAKVNISIEDQWQIYRNFQFSDFLKKSSGSRISTERQRARDQWRNASRSPRRW